MQLEAVRQMAGKSRHALRTAHRAYRMTSNKKFQKPLDNKQSCGIIQLKKGDKDYGNLKSNVQRPRHRNFKMDGLQIQTLQQRLRKMPM